MAARKLLRVMDTSDDRSCIGVLLNHCRLDTVPCGCCWYADGQGDPTLVRVEVFKRIASRYVENILPE